MERKMIYKGCMAGVGHGNLAIYARELEIGTEFELERQPTNAFDKMAVSVNYKGDRVGWLQNKDPKMSGKKEVIANLLDAGCDLECRIIALDARMHPENQVTIAIWIVLGE